MTTTTEAPGTAHEPDQTPRSSAAAGSSARERPSRWTWPVAVLLLLLLGVLTFVSNRPPSSLPLAPDNPDPAGARAAAEILRDQGVEIAFRRSVASAAAATDAEATLFVTNPALLSAEQWDLATRSGSDIVLTNVAFADLSPLTSALETTASGGDGVRQASCSDPDAVAAGEISTGSGDVRATDSRAVICFPGDDPEAGAYAVLTEGGRRITVLANSYPITNSGLDEAGNAALVLRMLGRTRQLTWFVPSPTDAATGSGGSLLPPGAGAVALWAALVVATTGLWRGRRLGRVVTEPLPVVVPPAETTRGRARLYRRARAHGHAAAALRAAAASRVASRLGVPESAGPEALLEAVSRATARTPDEVGVLLYGPAPQDDAGLLALVRELDALEGEVRG